MEHASHVRLCTIVQSMLQAGHGCDTFICIASRRINDAKRERHPGRCVLPCECGSESRELRILLLLLAQKPTYSICKIQGKNDSIPRSKEQQCLHTDKFRRFPDTVANCAYPHGAGDKEATCHSGCCAQ